MTIHHQHHGQGEPGLVFIHGFLCHLEHWRHQSEYFRHRTEVLAVIQQKESIFLLRYL